MGINIDREARRLAEECDALLRARAARWSSFDERLRDYVDLRTGGDLNALQLDALTEATARRINNIRTLRTLHNKKAAALAADVRKSRNRD